MSGRRDDAGRVVAFDPGSVRIGVAVSDTARTMAFPRPSIPAGARAVERCAATARAEDAVVAVVGHPLSMDGSAGAAATAADELAAGIAAALVADAIEVVLHDERLTTVSAAARLRSAGVSSRAARDRIDGEAAVVLLESWMAR